MTQEQRKCSECEKPSIHCKGMCQACYSRQYRKSKNGYSAMREYNRTKGLAAQKRYRDKNRTARPPKLPNVSRKTYPVSCECGGVPLCKGLCSSCYQKNRYALRHPTDKEKIDFLPVFEKVLEAVKSGDTIIHSLSVLRFNSRAFYNNMSEAQKHELSAYRLTSKKTYYNEEIIEL